MKIALFHELTPLSGARKVVEYYGQILKKRHTVDLYYVDNKKDNRAYNKFSNIYFYKFKNKYWNGGNWVTKLYIDSIELVRLYFLHKKISTQISKRKYDLIIINPSKLTQAPFILSFLKTAVYFCEEPLRLVYDGLFRIPKDLNVFRKVYEIINRRFRKFIDLSNIKNAKLILSNSEFSKTTIKKAYNLASFVCYLGVDVSNFKPVNSHKDYDVIFVGEKNKIEGYDLLKKALMYFQNRPKVLFVTRNEKGEGANESELIKLINQSKIAVSLSRREPFGLFPLEAMSCEVPVIAVSEGGLKETVIDGKTGYLIKRDSTELFRKISLLLNNEILRRKLGSNARQHVLENFSWEKSVKCLLNILKIENLLPT